MSPHPSYPYKLPHGLTRATLPNYHPRDWFLADVATEKAEPARAQAWAEEYRIIQEHEFKRGIEFLGEIDRLNPDAQLQTILRSDNDLQFMMYVFGGIEYRFHPDDIKHFVNVHRDGASRVDNRVWEEVTSWIRNDLGASIVGYLPSTQTIQRLHQGLTAQDIPLGGPAMIEQLNQKLTKNLSMATADQLARIILVFWDERTTQPGKYTRAFGERFARELQVAMNRTGMRDQVHKEMLLIANNLAPDTPDTVGKSLQSLATMIGNPESKRRKILESVSLR
jgi:hypothetical protein